MTGRNTTASVNDVEITAKKISRLPSNAACRIGRPLSSFRNMFSVTTIPSSTTRPVARTIPNNVRMLIEKPHMYMTKNVATSDMGISINGRTATSRLRKKNRITMTTSENAMISVSSTSLIDWRTRRVLSIRTLNVMSDLLDFWISARRLLNSSEI